MAKRSLSSAEQPIPSRRSAPKSRQTRSSGEPARSSEPIYRASSRSRGASESSSVHRCESREGCARLATASRSTWRRCSKARGKSLPPQSPNRSRSYCLAAMAGLRRNEIDVALERVPLGRRSDPDPGDRILSPEATNRQVTSRLIASCSRSSAVTMLARKSWFVIESGERARRERAIRALPLRP